jgi:3,4-dihydroxy-2-butanone 4-phosphate synthase
LPADVLCELTNDDGTISRYVEIASFAEAQALPLLTVAGLISYHLRVKGRDRD